MRRTALSTAILLALYAPHATATPVVNVDAGRLTTENVEILTIVGSSGTVINRVAGEELIMGEPGYGQFFGETTLDLSPGDYTVNAWAPPAASGVRETVSLSFTVLAPDRLATIRMAWTRLSAAAAAKRAADLEQTASVQAWRALAPTIVEIVAAQQGE
jgi:hypothetical protein